MSHFQFLAMSNNDNFNHEIDDESLSTAWRPRSEDPFVAAAVASSAAAPADQQKYGTASSPHAQIPSPSHYSPRPSPSGSNNSSNPRDVSPSVYRSNFSKPLNPPNTAARSTFQPVTPRSPHSTTPPRMNAYQHPQQYQQQQRLSQRYRPSEDDMPFDQVAATQNNPAPFFDEKDKMQTSPGSYNRQYSNRQPQQYKHYDDTAVPPPPPKEEKIVTQVDDSLEQGDKEYYEFEPSVSSSLQKPRGILKTGRSQSRTDDSEDPLVEDHNMSGPESAPSSFESKNIANSNSTSTGGSSSKGKSARRAPRRKNEYRESQDDLGDENSLEPYGASLSMKQGSSLKKRSEEAWEKRDKKEKRKLKGQAKNHDEVNVERSTSVSFGKKNRVHEFKRDESTNDDGTNITADNDNSEYTKSMESEVEDLIKDLFFIGEGTVTNPGRRKVKDAPAENYVGDENTVGESTLGDSTLDTYGDATLNTLDDFTFDNSTYTPDTYTPDILTSMGELKQIKEDDNVIEKNKQRSKAPQESPDEDDPVAALLEYVQGGVTAAACVLGLEEPTGASGAKDSKGKTAVLVAATKSRQDVESNLEVINAIDTDKDKYEGSAESLGDSAYQEVAVQSSQDSGGSEPEPSTFESFMNYATTLVLGPAEGKTSAPFDEESAVGDTPSSISTGLEHEARLAALAMHAATAKHEVMGYKLNNNEDVGVMTQFKFSIVKMQLPMGILFQENGGGCWVTKVFPSGNAALNAKGGTVEAGDQLAAINGVSAADMKVDKICLVVARLPKGEDIELTFLRYTGPIHTNGSKKMEGIEVEDLAVSSPERRKKGFLKKKKSSPGEEQVKAINCEIKMSEATELEGETKEKKKFKLFGRGKKKKSSPGEF